MSVKQLGQIARALGYPAKTAKKGKEAKKQRRGETTNG
jgi:hypothetical protein